MNKDTLSAELLALAKTSPGDPTRTKAARLRAVLPEVEAALASGASREQILKKLNEHGLDMSLGVFNRTLHRLRTAEKKGGRKRVPAQLAAKPEPAAPDLLRVQALLGAAPAASPESQEFHGRSEPVDLEALAKLAKGKQS